jgi:stringent starvation protein B
MGAVLGIYARENGEGLFFSADEYERPSEQEPEAPVKRPGLHIVK